MIALNQKPSDLVAALTRDIIANAAANRQGVGRGNGDRPAPSLAGKAVHLRALTEEVQDASGRSISTPVTEAGYLTALRREPPVLAKLSRDDPRRMAIVAYATAVERIGAVRGASLSDPTGGRASSGATPDGGVTSRIKFAATVRRARAAVYGWHGSDDRCDRENAAPRPVLEARRGKARTITATDLLDAVAIEGLDMSALLTRHGWSTHSAHRTKLTTAFVEIADILADALGYGNLTRSRSCPSD